MSAGHGKPTGTRCRNCSKQTISSKLICSDNDGVGYQYEEQDDEVDGFLGCFGAKVLFLGRNLEVLHYDVV
jgi:hypothetical protein